MRLRFGNPVIEPVDIVLVQLQKTPYVVRETPSDSASRNDQRVKTSE